MLLCMNGVVIIGWLFGWCVCVCVCVCSLNFLSNVNGSAGKWYDEGQRTTTD